MRLRVFAFGFMLLCFCLFAVQSRAQQVGLHDMVNVNVTGAPGTGTFTLGTAIPPYLGFAAVATSGETISYAAQDGAGNWERGRGVWTSGGVGGTLTRGVKTSSNANNLISFGSGVTIFNAALAEDMVSTTYPSSVLALITVPACAPSTTTGTITLTLNACANPVTPAIGGSPHKWHIGPLTGDGNLIWSNPTVGQEFIMEIAANGHNLALPTFIGPTPAATVSGNSFLVCDVFDSTPTYWCPAGVQTGLGGPSLFAFVNANSCVSAGGPTCTVSSISMTGADLLIVCASWQTFTGDISGVPTDSSSNVYTQAVLVNNSTQSTKTACYYKQAPSVTGSMTFTASFTANTFPYIAAIGFSGSVSSPLDQTNSNFTTSTGTSIQPGSITPTQNNELVLAFLGIDANNASSGNAIDSGYTLKNSQNFVPGTNLGGAMGYLIQTTAAATNPTFSWTAINTAQAMIISFK